MQLYGNAIYYSRSSKVDGYTSVIAIGFHNVVQLANYKSGSKTTHCRDFNQSKAIVDIQGC